MESGTLTEEPLFPAAGESAGDINNNEIAVDEKIDEIFSIEITPNDPAFDLKTEACILQLAYAQDKLLSLSNSRTQILAHQVESTHRIINALSHRFMIADEVGLGKTIEAGLVIKELIFRNGYSRILIICPASLLFQWQNELQSKFNEAFLIMDRGIVMKAIRGRGNGKVNPWEVNRKIICSIDFIKSTANMEYLKDIDWDMIIFDEAHRLRRDFLKSTLSYNAAKILSAKTKSLLLLTATPFRGKLEELYYLVRLIDKNLLGPFQTFSNSYCLNNSNMSELKEKLSSVIIRRTKKEVGGFTRRHARTIQFEFYPEERALYDATTSYVIEEFNLAMQTENRAVGFVMTVFQKLLDSSCAALNSALLKRKGRLEQVLETMKNGTGKGSIIEKDFRLHLRLLDDFDDDADSVEEIWKKGIAETEKEIRTLGRLISLAEKVTETKKGVKLRELIEKINAAKKKKILIFTQFRTTQDYLCAILSGLRVEIFNGSMDRARKEEAIANFKGDSDILISTEAGGEGRNLQFCSILVNYDLPWSPLKIEQRIGRIHRFGQTRDVSIYNFSVKNTISQRVLEVLTKKLKLFEESIGTPDILLGQIEEELNFNRVFMEMAAGKSVRRVSAELDQKIDAAKRNYEKLADLSVIKTMDFNYDEYYRVTLKERRYSNERIENFVNRVRSVDPVVDLYLGRKNEGSRLYKIKASPAGDVEPGRYGTFDSEKALENDRLDFLAFGNPIVDAVFQRCRSVSFGRNGGIAVIRHKERFFGMLINYLVTFRAGSEFQELIPVFSSPLSPVDDDITASMEEGLPGFEKVEFNRRGCHGRDLERVRMTLEMHTTDARKRLMDKIQKRYSSLYRSMNGGVAGEMEKITDSYDKKIGEYEKQLEYQVCQMKWFDKDMKSAITRTKTRIAETAREKEDQLAKCRELLNFRCSIELVNASIVIAGR